MYKKKLLKLMKKGCENERQNNRIRKFSHDNVQNWLLGHTSIVWTTMGWQQLNLSGLNLDAHTSQYLISVQPAFNGAP